MKFSESWLREWVNPNLSTDELCQQLTLAGLEIEGVENAAPDFDSVVVAEIQEVEAHPDADKLRVCNVNNGTEILQIVCGAPNVYAGMKAPLIQIGGYLTDADGKSFKIKKSKLRGVESYGMLCSPLELGLAEESNGLLELPQEAPIGVDVREYLKLNDKIIEVDLTPNRGDCLGIRGLAREVAALNGLNFTDKSLDTKRIESVNTESVPVSITATDGCLGFTGRVVKNIDVKAATPTWMQEKLRRAGLRPIHPVVDISNYVMLESGQPTHTFDLRVIDESITVRYADQGEKLTLLDGKVVELSTDIMVIADKSKALAMAGIMGGEHSGIKDDTKDVFIECAHFTPLYIAGKARRFGMHTDASHRFERGVDPSLMVPVVERITELLLEIVGGEPGPIQFINKDNKVAQSPEITPNIYEKNQVSVSHQRLESMLGLAFKEEQVLNSLNRLSISTKAADGVYNSIVPTHRFDISIAEDLVEEVGRVYGLSNIQSVPLRTDARLKLSKEKKLSVRRIKEALINRGYSEAINYSFISQKEHDSFFGSNDPVKLQNPISADLEIMRESLLPSLISALQFNQKRQQERLSLFEVGSRYKLQDHEIKENKMISLVRFGNHESEQWGVKSRKTDFFDFKSDVEALLDLRASDYLFRVSDHQLLHPGQAAEIIVKGVNGIEQSGILGQLHPSIQRQYGLDKPVFLAEFPIDLLITRNLPKFESVSSFPASRRDLSLLVPKDISAQQLLDCSQMAGGERLLQSFLFDLYQGESVESGQKSVGLGLIFQEKSRTLTDEEIDADMQKITQSLASELGAHLRA